VALKFLKNKYLITSLILFSLLVIFFNRQIFYDKTLVPLDILKEFDLALKESGASSENYLLSDIVVQFHPNYDFIYQSINSARIPFWNPYILTGAPFFADSQTAVFELTHLLSYAFKILPLSFPLFSALISLFIFGLSFFAYLKNLKFDSMVALFGTVTLTFSGAIIVWVNHPLISTFIWLPLLLFCADKIASDKNPKYLPLLSLAVCFMLLAGYPQLSLINLIMAGLYFLFRSYQHKTLKIKNISMAVLFLLIGIGLSAVQTGPSWDFIKKSNSYEVGRGYIGHDNFIEIAKKQFSDFNENIILDFKKTAVYGILAFNPEYYGSPVDRNYQNPEKNPYANFSEVTIYAGFLTILLAVISIIFFKKNKAIIFWLVAGAISFSLAANLPFLNLLKYLPLINKISTSRFRLIFTFAIVLLAAYSLQKIFNYVKNKNLKLANALLAGLILISFFDLFYFFHNFNAGAEKDDSFILQNNAVKFLKDNTEYERIIGLGKPENGFKTALIPDISMLAGLYDVRGYNPIVHKNYADFAGRYLTRRGSFYLADAIFNEKIIDLMGIKYIVCPKDGCLVIGRDEEWKREYEDNNVDIYLNSTFLPRSYVAYDFINPLAGELAINLLDSADFNPYSKIIVDKPGNDKNLIAQNDQPIKKADIIEYSNNEVIISAETDKNGILVLTDSYDDGWKAEVNGREEKVLLVNGIFRGVFIPKGENKIIFRYAPKNFYFYASITLFSLFFLIISAILVNKRILFPKLLK